MAETFTYSPQSKVYRRKSLTRAQKFLLYVIVLVNFPISGALVIYTQERLKESPFLFVLILAPTLLTFALLLLVVLNPKGPEQNFILPGPEPDPDDSSTIKGMIRLTSGETREVSVVVPNVHGISSTSFLTESVAEAGTDQLAVEEMFELALETVQLKYPECAWSGDPAVS